MKDKSPTRWACDITQVLNAVLHIDDRFPVRTRDVALEYTKQAFSDDPITLVKGASLKGFEGALYKAPSHKKGWGIIYNDEITVPGRQNFTLAHEFGHYLLHRLKFPDGLQCSQEDMARWNNEHKKIESEANLFAAQFLMPLDDYRKQIDDKSKADFKTLGYVADERYEVSLTAATLRWLEYTRVPAMLVASREGFVLWARSSTPAYKNGLYIKTSNMPPIPVPGQSLAAQRDSISNHTADKSHDPDVWFKEYGCHEEVLFSERHDVTLSLLHFQNLARKHSAYDDNDELTAVDTFMAR